MAPVDSAETRQSSIPSLCHSFMVFSVVGDLAVQLILLQLLCTVTLFLNLSLFPSKIVTTSPSFRPGSEVAGGL